MLPRDTTATRDTPSFQSLSIFQVAGLAVATTTTQPMVKADTTPALAGQPPKLREGAVFAGGLVCASGPTLSPKALPKPRQANYSSARLGRTQLLRQDISCTICAFVWRDVAYFCNDVSYERSFNIRAAVEPVPSNLAASKAQATPLARSRTVVWYCLTWAISAFSISCFWLM